MLKTLEEYRYKFHCPIRHPSRDMTSIPYVDRSSVFDKKMAKMAFLPCPAHISEFLSELLTTYLNRVCIGTESRVFLPFLFLRKL